MAAWKRALAGGILAAGLTACVSAPEDSPEWFQQRAATEAGTYPRLQDVPNKSDANTDPAHWESVRQNVLSAGVAMRAHPRAEQATADQDPAAFVDAARRDLEAARDAHPQ